MGSSFYSWPPSTCPLEYHLIMLTIVTVIVLVVSNLIQLATWTLKDSHGIPALMTVFNQKSATAVILGHFNN